MIIIIIKTYTCTSTLNWRNHHNVHINVFDISNNAKPIKIDLQTLKTLFSIVTAVKISLHSAE